MIRRFVVFGASGDLTARYLLPALAQLQDNGRLEPGVEIVGVAVDEGNTESFRRHAAASLARHAAEVPATARDAIVSALSYRRGDVTDPSSVSSALGASGAPVVAYLALPPSVFAPAVAALGAARLARGSRVVIEKPFGHDLTSARELNELLHRSIPEDAVFRIDHFLGMQTVQNVLGLRFANRLFEPVWNSNHVERVDIVWDETLALEGRAGYYDRSGALRDMVQNHLLQLLCLVAMEAPRTLSARDLRNQKVELLRAVRGPAPEEMSRHTVRARYGAGEVAGRRLVSYVDEDGVDPARGTETFAAVTLFVDNWRWAGTPFVLRTGKALAADRHHVHVHFKPVPHLAFGQTRSARGNVLRLEMTPDVLALDIETNGAGDPFVLEPAELACALAPQDLSAYARLLLDAMDGDPILSIRDDEVEESWRIVDPIREGWDRNLTPLTTYPAGSAGPG